MAAERAVTHTGRANAEPLAMIPEPDGPPQVSVLIVAWNSGELLSECLAALLAQTYTDFEVIVVDNDSTDEATSDLVQRFPALDLRVERLQSNLGFAAGNNIGARLARGSWLALLNPDAFPAPDWLAQLMRAAALYPSACFASRQLQALRPELLDGEGDEYHLSGLAWRHGYNSVAPPAGEIREVFSACAAAALLPRADFVAAGGFDDAYFAYHEDVDLGFRLRLRGLKCLLVPGAVVRHVGYSTSSRRSDMAVYYGHRNLVWTYAKDMPLVLFWICLPLHLMMNVIALVYFTLRGQGSVIWKAKIDALRGLPAALLHRRAVQAARVVTTAQLVRVMNRRLTGPLQGWVSRHASA